MAPIALQAQFRAGPPRKQTRLTLAFPQEKQKRSRVHRAFDAEMESHLAVPRRGHVLSSVADFYGSGIRDAVTTLAASIARTPPTTVVNVLRTVCAPHSLSSIHRSEAEIAAWLIAAMWVSGVAAQAVPVSAPLFDGGRWFFGTEAISTLAALPTADAVISAEISLRKRADPSAYFELLPYLLDPHGPGSRLSVMRDPATQPTRSRRREEGVFYTPADIANYMVAACLDELNADSPPTIFDPACGTGVFLRASLSKLQRQYPDNDVASLASECLFGTDIDPWALEATAFVLVIDAWNSRTSVAPVEIWRRLRRNFACIDALKIDPAPNNQPNNDDDRRRSIPSIFPALKHGPSIILGNPPYADLGVREDLSSLANAFQTIATKRQASAEMYVAFVEQMIRLAAPDVCAGALVLPLSIACNVGPQFSTVRKLIAETPGQWRFAFFDREPHALFGEDVKTRNAIVLWSRASRDVSNDVFTGPLRKWRGDNRAAMFKSLQFTPIETEIREGIPKISGECEARALKILTARWSRLEQTGQLGRVTLSAAVNGDDQTVFIGATAYNFLNVFLRPAHEPLRGKSSLSEHPLHAISCGSPFDAMAIFALLSSHLAYWWWHAHGDGFHVTSRFLSTFPFGVDALTEPVGKALSGYGEELWEKIRNNPVVSLNRGRTSLAFSPNGRDAIRRKIDQALAELAGLEAAFVDELQQFTAHTVAAKLRAAADPIADNQESP